MQSTNTLNTFFKKPFLILIMVQIVFLTYAIFNNHHFTNDSVEYLNQAGNLIEHGSLYCGDYNVLEKDPGLYSRRPPAYAVFLLMTTFFLHLNLGALLIQCFLSVFNIYMGFKILQLIFTGKAPLLRYVFLFLVFPTQFIYAVTYMSEIPFQTALLLSIFFLLRFEKSGYYKNLYLSHLFLALTYLFKPITLFLWLGLILYTITIKSDHRGSKHLTLLGLGHFLLLGFFFLNNFALTGIAEYTSIGRKVVLNYNIPAVLSRAYGEEVAQHKMDSVQNEMTGMPYVMQCVYTDNFIRNTLLTRPFDFSLTHALGVPRFFLESGRWDLELWYKGKDEAGTLPSLKSSFKKEGIRGLTDIIRTWPVLYSVYYILVIAGTIFIFIFFVKGIFSPLISRRHRFLFLFIIFYFVLLTGPSASSRFRLPVFPLIAIVAIAGWPAGKKMQFMN
ncbi:MAG: hypothetical protein IPN36_06365 [Bacteroidetes bacterium]|nr:hypothetical protein [Bacteroidota bacterium]